MGGDETLLTILFPHPRIHDLAAPKAHGEALARAIPGAQLVELPAAHIPALEVPGAFMNALLGILINPPITTKRERYDAGSLS